MQTEQATALESSATSIITALESSATSIITALESSATTITALESGATGATPMSETVVGWAGLGMLALIFAANGLGVVDQSVAVRELAATGVPEGRARAAVALGRVAQVAGVIGLFVEATRVYAAAGLAVFLVVATVTGHAFWRATGEERGRQLAGFLKNIAIVGGLGLAAGWRSA